MPRRPLLGGALTHADFGHESDRRALMHDALLQRVRDAEGFAALSWNS